MKKVSTTTPKITAKHITGHGPDNGARVQSIRLPDLYQKVGEDLVRYRISLDTSYLIQSHVVAEVWVSGNGWTELARLYMDREFFIISGPDQKATDPKTRELTGINSISTKGAEYVAQSWQKVVTLLAAEAKMVLTA